MSESQESTLGGDEMDAKRVLQIEEMSIKAQDASIHTQKGSGSAL